MQWILVGRHSACKSCLRLGGSIYWDVLIYVKDYFSVKVEAVLSNTIHVFIYATEYPRNIKYRHEGMNRQVFAFSYNVASDMSCFYEFDRHVSGHILSVNLPEILYIYMDSCQTKSV